MSETDLGVGSYNYELNKNPCLWLTLNQNTNVFDINSWGAIYVLDLSKLTTKKNKWRIPHWILKPPENVTVKY